MIFNRTNIIIIAILGIILLYSYYYFLNKNSSNATKLWGRIKPPLLYVYYISMLLSTIGFLLLFYYLIIGRSFTQQDIMKLTIALVFIVVISMLWLPLSLNYLKDKSESNKYLVIFVLFLVAMSSLYLLFDLNKVNEKDNLLAKRFAIYGMTYFFIHAFFFDNILWCYNFF